MAKKPPGKLKKVTREIQLDLSVGVVVLVVYAMLQSSLVLNVNLPHISHPGPLGQALMALVSRGLLLVLAPAMCFGVARIIDLNPWGLGMGTAVFSEVALDFLVWASGELEEEGVVTHVLCAAAVSALAGVLASLAARKALGIAHAHAAAQASLKPGSESQADLQAREFAEKMREAQRGASKPG